MNGRGGLGSQKFPSASCPFASHNWWFGIPYYVGLEDDYELGVKFVYDKDPWNIQLAFFKNEEWGNAGKTDRYSFDVVKALGEQNEEINQFNIRAAYTLDHGGLGSTEIGVSGLCGQLYNDTTDGFGSRWAASAHLNGLYRRWNLMLEIARYGFDPHNPPGMDNRSIAMGAFDTAFPVATEGTALVANLAYELPLDWGPVRSLTF